MMMLLLSLLAACGPSGAEDVPTALVERGELRVELVIPGELKAVNSVTIATPDLDGQNKITYVVEEGSRVSEGDVVVRFDTTDLEEKLAQYLNELEIAETKIEQKQAQLAVRLTDLDNEITRAELSLERAKMRLTDSETVPRVERESARIDVKEFTLAVERAISSRESARLEGESELALLQLDATRAERRVERIRKQIDSCDVKAPANGLVILPEIWKGGSRGPIAVGDTVWSGSTLMELPDLSEMEVVAWVHEVDAAKAAQGQSAEIVIDAHPEPAHAGEVKRVADLAVKRERDSAVKHLKVTIAIPESQPQMKPGMTVRAELLVSEHEDVLSVPLEAVFQGEEGPYVQLASLGGFTPTSVELGEANDTHVIVLSGLEEGAEVALVDPEAAASGDPAPAASPGEGALPEAQAATE
ncbi:MAG: efflux RND transporter periplasmic adaptor subunit [Alphaproteobacteria bacterium]|nr:efflux RND transporter periplasmic adaptor subunit [Alphaproteobacteria bacterium]MCB9792874.1 efflux RND transporter periplasmic adaptor subunit [Alphaproteobacteria bacterium]